MFERQAGYQGQLIVFRHAEISGLLNFLNFITMRPSFLSSTPTQCITV